LGDTALTIPLARKSNGKLTQQYDNFGLTLPYSFIGYRRRINAIWTVKNYTNAMVPMADFREFESSGGTLALSNRLVNTIALENGFAAEVSFLWSKRYSNGYFVHHAHNDLSVTVQKKLKKPNLLVYLTASDMLKGMNSDVRSLYGSLNYLSSGYGDTRNVKLGLYWSFGNQKLRIREKEASGIEEFSERLK